MLRVPGTGDITPLLVQPKIEKITAVSLPESFQRAQERRAAEGGGVAAGAGGELRTRRRQHSMEEQPDWEKMPSEKLVRISKSKRSGYGVWLIISVALLILLGGAAGVMVLRKRNMAVDQPIVIAPVVGTVAEIKESVPEAIDLPLEMNGNQVELIKELESLSASFLNASTVDELLKYVRERSQTEPKIRAYYPDGKIAAPGMSAFNTTGAISFNGRLASIAVRTKDFAEKQLAFVRTVEGLKVDWESYVAWSEMPWSQFISEKPVRPLVFRAKLRSLDYYNFGFSDEDEWRSYELRAPDGEYVLYGYVKRDSALDQKIRPLESKASILVTLSLKYPPGKDVKDNQVIIDGMVGNGWVVGVEK